VDDDTEEEEVLEEEADDACGKVLESPALLLVEVAKPSVLESPLRVIIPNMACASSMLLLVGILMLLFCIVL